MQAFSPLGHYKKMSRGVPPIVEIIVIDDDVPPSPAKPIETCPTTSPSLTLCYRCHRTMPPICLVFRSTLPLCADCQGLCSVCRRVIDSELLRCPRCARAYHETCESRFRIRQICSLCLDEVRSNVKETVETRYESTTLYGQPYAVVKLRDLSLIHLVYMPESLVQDLLVSGQPPPPPQFEAVLSWTTGPQRMGLVKFANLSKTHWEHEFVIKALTATHDTKVLIEKAQELILAFGYTPEDSFADLLHA